MKKKTISLFFSVPLMLFAIIGCSQEESNPKTYDGRVFDISVNQDKSLTATSIKNGYDYDLTISGQGQALDYGKKELVPWNPIIKKIKNVTINEGITNIGDYFFSSLPLDYFILPSTVTSVKEHSFNAQSVIYTYGGLLNNINNEVYYYSENKPTSSGHYFYTDEEGVPHPWILTPISFLFIGNSFTYRGVNTMDTTNPEVPNDFKKIANNLNIEVNIDSVCKGSHTLTKFANPEDEMGAIVAQKLNNNQYDYVILQEQSTAPINNYNTFLNAVISLKTKIDQTQNKCQTILYETWGTPYNTSNDPTTYGTTPGAMEAKLRTAYKNAGDESGCKVNYVGKAFTYAYENTNINIYADDNRHQNGLGAYLSAAVHARSIFKVNVSNCSDYCGLNENECKALLGVADTII